MTQPPRFPRAAFPRAHAALAGLVLLLLVGLATPAAEDSTPKQGADLLKVDLLGVFAHPDDETGLAATLAKYGHGQKRAIALAYITRGEGGGNMVGTQGGPALGILRETELRECLGVLGVRHAFFLDQTDFFYTESLSATLRKWDKEQCLGRLVRLVRSLRPEVIVTMNPAPRPGQHGHHQAAGVLAIEAFNAAADPKRFPEQLSDEGLAPWRTRKLFYGGPAGTQGATITTSDPMADGRSPADLAGAALAHHRSQGFGGFLNAPWLRRPQSFVLVKSTVAPVPNATDLFANLPAPEPVRPVALHPPLPPPELAFQPRPAITNYLRWAAEQDIAALAAEFTVDLPVVAGEPNLVPLRLAGSAANPLAPLPRLFLPDGWTSDDGRVVATQPLEGFRLVHYRVLPPSGTLADADVRATVPLPASEASARARLHPVPRASIPRVPRPPPLDGSLPGWETAMILDIGTNRVWEGRTDGPEDCSATAHVAHDGTDLFVAIEVRDDIVVSNIEPNDIRGHWRSDSVEICLDPVGGAEDTTGCFKIGIFPFDTTGRVRAARDADARQGPVETTAPGLRLASRRTPAGYRVQVAIPLALVKDGSRNFPRRLGFNVLIYDGDKAGAARGENINQGRLAWAPRSGVQGRPEDWGRIDLE